MKEEKTERDFDFTQELCDMKDKYLFMFEVAHIQFYNEREGERLLSEEATFGFDLVGDILKKEFEDLVERAGKLS
jgi:hypothetical protein